MNISGGKFLPYVPESLKEIEVKQGQSKIESLREREVTDFLDGKVRLC